MKKSFQNINLLMQLTPPDSNLKKTKPPEIYPHLYIDSDEDDYLKDEVASSPKDPKHSKDYDHLVEETLDIDEIPADMTLLLERTLRSGQSIRYPGHVVLMGDINPGAEVVAGGNILVLGALRGVAHAGAYGNLKAVVTAFRLSPTQLRIAGNITRAPDNGDDGTGYQQPEIARIIDGSIVIEKYNSAWIKNS